MKKSTLVVLLATCCCWPLYAQQVKSIIIDESANGKIFSTFLHELEKQYAVDFIFDEEEVMAYTVQGVSGRTRLTDYLDSYLIHFTVVRVQDNVVFIVNKSMGDAYGNRKENYLVLEKPEQEGALSLEGTITDAGNNEPIVGAQVMIESLNQGTLTDVEGQFSLKAPPGLYQLDVQYVGFEPTSYIVGFSPYGTAHRISATIFPESKELESVVVTADRVDQNVSGKLTGIEKLSIETIRTLPTFLGE